MTKTVKIDGNAIHDIASFYEEINRVFMAGEAWSLGPSLDALSDMLYGGYGAIDGKEPVQLVWIAMEKNKFDLGLEATKAFYQAKLEHPETFSQTLVTQRLAELIEESGPTYFDMILEIIAEHPNITVVAR